MRSVPWRFRLLPGRRRARGAGARAAVARWLLVSVLLLGVAAPAAAQEVPEWFALSFLDLPEDIAEAARDGKRVMLYFWQEGCPSCRRFTRVTFADPQIVAEVRRHFVPIAIDIHGSRDVTWTDGAILSEKRLAGRLGIWGTPTLLFLDERGAVALRLHGYLAPEQFAPALREARKGRPG
jgi:thioredoxin-related protein